MRLIFPINNLALVETAIYHEQKSIILFAPHASKVAKYWTKCRNYRSQAIGDAELQGYINETKRVYNELYFCFWIEACNSKQFRQILLAVALFITEKARLINEQYLQINTLSNFKLQCELYTIRIDIAQFIATHYFSGLSGFFNRNRSRNIANYTEKIAYYYPILFCELLLSR